jgi:hypothetical protein
VTDRIVVSATWLGDSLNGSQTAAVLRATAPGTYEVELPTRTVRRGPGQDASEQPRRLVVEIAPPDADLHQLARDLVADEPRWDGLCVFCRQPAHAVHVDNCLVARARRHLALLASAQSHPASRTRRR